MTGSRSPLPARRTRLIGRAEELATLVQRLREGAVRLVTLLGAGGVGKTSLALEAARELETAFADGASLVDLSAVQDRDALALACCDALGLVDRAATPTGVLTAHLAPRRCLVVLDNCEHLAEAVGALVDHLLDACPDLRVLATSRVKLGIGGEVVHSLGPLRVPAAGAEADSGGLADVPSVELFVERASHADPAFSLSGSEAPVVSICRALDGIPLAIELAAAQLPALTPAEVVDRLSRLVGIDGRPRGGAARQRTMEATIASSYDLLDERERVLFRRLAVFRGGWTLPAAEHVGSLGMGEASIAATLVSLVEQSLVVREGAGTTSRFRMLAPVADHARRRLAASDEARSAAIAHAHYYLAAIRHGAPDWRMIEPERLESIAAELENCEAAMQVAAREGLVPLVLGFNVALLLFWRIRGHLRSGMRHLEAALPLVDDPASAERAMILAGLAHFGQLLGDPAAAAARAAESEAIFERLGDVVGRRTVIGFRGDIAADQGDDEAALAHYARARALVVDHEDALDLGFWHANVGRVAVRSGDLDAAEEQLRQAATQLRDASWYRGYVLAQLGSIARRRGDLDHAELLLSESLGLLASYGAALEAASCLVELARSALDRHAQERAAELFGAATGLRDRVGAPIEADERTAMAADIDLARQSLPTETFATAWSRGLDRSLQETVDWLAAPSSPEPPKGRGPQLTRREDEIARLVALGLTNRQIAERLVISPGTVRTHVERILGKLGLTSRVQVATWVIRRS